MACFTNHTVKLINDTPSFGTTQLSNILCFFALTGVFSFFNKNCNTSFHLRVNPNRMKWKVLKFQINFNEIQNHNNILISFTRLGMLFTIQIQKRKFGKI